MSRKESIEPDGGLDAVVSSLEATGDFRVLRRLVRRSSVMPYDGSPTRLGLFVDVETTGLDPDEDEIIELAMVQFVYAIDGRIFEIREPIEALREPAKPISAAITALTGITDEMVAGKKLDPDIVSRAAAKSDLILAHNAGFDRRFLERMSSVFASKPWACSMSQVDWAAEGFEGTKLGYLAMGSGFFYDRHRAANDCLAALELLATRLPVSGEFAMARLLERARKHEWRIWAEEAPFARKDELKRRGYRWNGEGKRGPKAWFRDVEDNAKDEELAFLRNEIYRVDRSINCRKVTALERFSDRTDATGGFSGF
jgi:DNA polymerase-3 subunit epsilon